VRERKQGKLLNSVIHIYTRPPPLAETSIDKTLRAKIAQ